MVLPHILLGYLLVRNRSTWRAPARALTLSEVSPLYGAIGWTYFAAASFAIVYLGEHYVADVVVGLAVAELVRRDEPITAPFVRAVARAVQ